MIWRKKHNSLDEIFKSLEHAVQDDVAMFLEFGEEYFSLEELEMMYFRWETVFNKTDKLRGRYIIMCTSSLFLIPFACVLVMSGNTAYLPIFFITFPLIFLAGAIGFLLLYLKHGRLAYQESVGRRLKYAIRNKRIKQGLSKDSSL